MAGPLIPSSVSGRGRSLHVPLYVRVRGTLRSHSFEHWKRRWQTKSRFNSLARSLEHSIMHPRSYSCIDNTEMSTRVTQWARRIKGHSSSSFPLAWVKRSLSEEGKHCLWYFWISFKFSRFAASRNLTKVCSWAEVEEGNEERQLHFYLKPSSNLVAFSKHCNTTLRALHIYNMLTVLDVPV